MAGLRVQQSTYAAASLVITEAGTTGPDGLAPTASKPNPLFLLNQKFVNYEASNNNMMYSNKCCASDSSKS